MSDSGAFRTVGAVVAALTVAFGIVVAAVQFGAGDAAAVVTLPLVVVVPAVAAGLYWYLRRR